MSTDSEESSAAESKPFFNKSGFGQAILRLKTDETLEEGVSRLRREGWIIPDLTSLKVNEDSTGRYFEQR